MFEAKGKPLYMLLIDWEKAFDKIHPDALQYALHRMGVPQHYIDLLKAITIDPQFTVAYKGQESQPATASSGIRQGCPLSPYLFLIVHTVILKEAREHFAETRQSRCPEEVLPPHYIYSYNTPLTDLCYAEDTLLLSKTATGLQDMLHSLQTIAQRFNLRLNLTKCELLQLNGEQDVYFTNGVKVPVKTKARYLGAILTPNGNCYHDVTARIQKAHKHFKSLQQFWRGLGLSLRWRLRVFHSIFVPMLMFGMETASLTAIDIARLDSTYHTLLRRVHRIPSTYYTKILDPTKTTVSNADLDPQSHFIRTLTQRRVSVAFHLLALPQSNLQRDCCLTAAFTFRDLKGPRRIGRPRTQWMPEVFKAAFKGYFPDKVYQYPGALLDLKREVQRTGRWTCLSQWTENVQRLGLSTVI